MPVSSQDIAAVRAVDDHVWRGPIIGAVVLLALGTWLFWDFLSSQVRWAIKFQADWGHTLVIPLIAGYFVYLNREKLLARPFRTTWVGLVPVILGMGWYALCSLGPMAIRHHNLQGAGVWLTLVGLVLLFCGFRAMVYLAFPLIYLLVFGQTVSERFMNIVTFKLQDVTARGSHVVLLLLGLDVERSGNTIYVFNGHAGGSSSVSSPGTPAWASRGTPLNIAEACSGMRMLMAFLALGVAIAYTSLKRFWQRALLVILAFPVAIAVNILRVVTLALLSLLDAGLAVGNFHSFIGLIWLVPAFLMYLGVLWVIRNLVTEGPAPPAGPDAAATEGAGG